VAQAEPVRDQLEGRWILGARAGFGLWTQQVDPTLDSGSSIGPALNFQALYGLNNMIAAGLLLEWERRGGGSSGDDFGTIGTVSLLPTIEVHPMRYRGFDPYLTASLGVNFNSFGESATSPSASFSNTFAFRLGAGIDYMLTDRLALNTEMAWKRNRGTVEFVGAESAWDASSLNFLFGVRYKF